MYLLNSYLGLETKWSKTPLFSECKDNFLKYKINNFLIKKYSVFAVLSMKSFTLFSIGCKIAFLSHISSFFYSVALLCIKKKLKSETKILIFRFNQKSLNDFYQKNSNPKIVRIKKAIRLEVERMALNYCFSITMILDTIYCNSSCRFLEDSNHRFR